MSFGILSTGFSIKRLSDILDEIEEAQKAAFGVVDTSSESVLGQLNGVFANQAAEVWEQLQKSYDAASPNLADGLTLDYNVALNRITRLASLATEVEVGLKGTNGTIVTQGTQVSSNTDGSIFQLKQDTTITPLTQVKIVVAVKNVVNSTLYTITINTTNYTYTSDSSATADEIATGLVADITADSGAAVTAQNIGNGVIMITTKSLSFDTAYDSNLEHYTISDFESVELGEILAVSDTLTVIETPLVGLDVVNNFEDGIKGREPETDTELRIRRLQSLQITGAGTLPAMVARILNDVDNVTVVKGFENRTDVVDGDGRPAHSLEIVIVGGDEIEIAQKIWDTKPAGIQTYGNDFRDITDDNGDTQRMYFSRPVNQYAWLIANITLYSEETFPSDGVDQIKEKILEYGDSLDIGEDIIPGRFYVPIYEVPGVDTIVITIAITATEMGTPSYGSTKISIDSDEISVWALTRITVNVI